ncbi:Hypothetical_protein [Hexamita inflata]|uniref:Hypothetical_protein n=1 Tax=Hexamita inflata TaxID=28002 RepID=A0AA86RA11_9EUKA|nr:Hypothetical protein HINF_LOCUS56618 [Hexamita inflata]
MINMEPKFPAAIRLMLLFYDGASFLNHRISFNILSQLNQRQQESRSRRKCSVLRIVESLEGLYTQVQNNQENILNFITSLLIHNLLKTTKLEYFQTCQQFSVAMLDIFK